MKKEEFYNLHADICKTISSPRRLAIIDNIRKNEMTVNSIAKKTGILQANLSQHLAILRAKGVVKARRDGNNTYYSIINPKIIEAYDLISETLKETIQSRNKTVTDVLNIRK
jgi:ArsR family transcriptional regulator